MKMHGQGSFFKKPIDAATALRSISPPGSPARQNRFPLNDNELPVLQYSVLSIFPELFHATFTRHGGRSGPPYKSLNISPGVGDETDCVTANLALLKSVSRAKHLFYTRQVHGCDILVAERGNAFRQEKIPIGDAIITDIPGMAIMVMQADCQGVILYDPENRVVATVHCGWRGQAQDILSLVVAKMQSLFGTRATLLRAAIGPSLGPCCAEFKGYRDLFPNYFREFMTEENYFNLWAVSVRQLRMCGLKQDHIEVAGICTRCATDHFFSFRGEGSTGRFGTVAMLKEIPMASKPENP